MQDRLLRVFGYWGLGLILFVCTLIVARWTIDFVKWSALDAGWAQVIGSIAALGVAIYVMSRQNAHAAKLLLEADKIAVARKALAVAAIANRAVIIVAESYETVTVPRSLITSMDSYRNQVIGSQRAIRNIHRVLEAIPAHELGSYQMAEGITTLVANLGSFDALLTIAEQQPDVRGNPHMLYVFYFCFEQIIAAKRQFNDGLNNIE